MGTVYSYKCGCGYSAELFCGSGMNGTNVGMIKKNIPEELFEKFNAELNAQNVETFCLGNAVIHCTKCRSLYSVSEFTYTLKDGCTEEYTAPCPSCGSEYPPEENYRNIPCPKCGGTAELSETGIWD